MYVWLAVSALYACVRVRSRCHPPCRPRHVLRQSERLHGVRAVRTSKGDAGARSAEHRRYRGCVAASQCRSLPRASASYDRLPWPDLLLLSKTAANVKDVKYACYFLRQIARIVRWRLSSCRLCCSVLASRVGCGALQLLRNPYKKFSQTNAVFEYIGSQCLEMVCPRAAA